MWACDDCDHETRRLRGLCGRRPISPALPGACVDEDGRIGVRGDLVVAGARGVFGAGVWAHCPVALARRDDVRRFIDDHRLRSRGLGGGPLSARQRAALLIRSAEVDAYQARPRPKGDA